MPTSDSPSPRLDLRRGTQRVFAHLLVSNAVVAVMNYTVWFAVTFWVFLETRSVFATGMIAASSSWPPRRPASGSAASSTTTTSGR